MEDGEFAASRTYDKEETMLLGAQLLSGWSWIRILSRTQTFLCPMFVAVFLLYHSSSLLVIYF